MPEIGRPEAYYAALAQQADRTGDVFTHEVAKVGQYITLALASAMDWPNKKRYFEHALRRHCVPPPLPDEEVWLFYNRLAQVVRQYAGQEALRIASSQDDQFAYLEKRGIPRRQIVPQAQSFFGSILGNDGCHKSELFTEEDWGQLRLIQSQWC